jgi:predicted dehydrogenase
MVRQAREMVMKGQLGAIRLVQAEYPQDWLTEAAEHAGSKQAEWRVDPKRSGAGGATGDIGTHAYNLARFVSGLELDSLSADLSAFGAGRVLDDNANVMLRFKERDGVAARGMIWASQVAPGNENGLKLRVYGTKGGLEWVQADPNYLWYTPFGQPKQLLTRGGAGSLQVAARVTRVPPGHPEGYLEGFATIYSDAAELIWAKLEDRAPDPGATLVPSVADGVAGVAFIEAVVASSRKDGAWTKVAAP